MAGHRKGYGRGKVKSPAKKAPEGSGMVPPVPDEPLPNKRGKGGRPRRSLAEWKGRWLQVFGATANVNAACKSAGIARSVYYEWLKKAPDFASEVEMARAEAVERLELEAWRRATDPDQPSDRVLMFLLEANAPDKYGKKQSLELTGAGGGPINVQSQGVVVSVSADRLRALQSDPEGARLLKALAFRDAELLSTSKPSTEPAAALEVVAGDLAGDAVEGSGG